MKFILFILGISFGQSRHLIGQPMGKGQSRHLIGRPIRRSVRGNRLFVDPTESIRLPAMNINLEPNIIHSCYKRIDPRTCSEFFNKMLDY